jgi:hypothetical protein
MLQVPKGPGLGVSFNKEAFELEVDFSLPAMLVGGTDHSPSKL